MPEGEASIITNNWTQIALGRLKKAIRRKAGLRAFAVLSGKMVIGLKGHLFSQFSAS